MWPPCRVPPVWADGAVRSVCAVGGVQPGADLGMVEHRFVAVDPGGDLAVVGQGGEVVIQQGPHFAGPVGCAGMAFSERVEAIEQRTANACSGRTSTQQRTVTGVGAPQPDSYGVITRQSPRRLVRAPGTRRGRRQKGLLPAGTRGDTTAARPPPAAGPRSLPASLPTVEAPRTRCTMPVPTEAFRDFDRLAQQIWGTAARPAAMPMDAWRDGEQIVVQFDLTRRRRLRIRRGRNLDTPFRRQ
jgi:hypothetical protein